MFARRPVSSAGPSLAPQGRQTGARGPLPAAVSAVLANPFVGAGGAAALFLAAGATLLLVTANPRAGAPSVRMKLDAPPPIKLDGAAGQSPDGLKPLDPAADPNAASGEAVIMLPQGASVVGGPAPSHVRAPVTPLPPAPIAGLTQPSQGGLLPIIARDGRTPFAAYARPFHDNGRPKVALVVGGLGLNAAATKAAIERLPPEVTLAFAAYADGLQGWIDLARSDGHEVLIEAPMEPLDYPNNDPGPYALMSGAGGPETVRRLEWILSRATGYFGVANYLGGKFLTTDGPMSAFMTALKGRGLAFIDDGTGQRQSLAGLPRASADTVVDADLSAGAIQRQLQSLEGTAGSKGRALGAAFAYPVTIEVVSRWAATLQNRGLQLAPASALARR